ncbi:MAG TPA: cofactor-independent phosphoglycerate mutase [Candidatus Binataceae bacterium]|jgi:2,3-bisphosphoglycerate-independent phosphoglycerate mutase|nr:cofactor-independent phosphoglycerate mutase [Candidatus Binataceae bacterium]
MKYVIVHGDGMADWPCPDLGGKTPLQAARKPNMDRIASCGELGLVATIPKGMPPGSDVGTMTMLGYDPHRYHTGRAPIEAASMGLDIGPDDVVFRMNLVTLSPQADGSAVMADFTSGHISSEEAAAIVADIGQSLGGKDFDFYNGVSYRHIMVWHGGPTDTTLTPPHDITDKAVAEHFPKGPGAERLRDLMARAAEILARHPVNAARKANGKPPASSVWFWGQGKRPAVPTLKQRFNAQGAVISAVDLVNGLGRLAGLEVVKVPGATGFLDTDYAAKGRYGLRALQDRDFLLVHIEAPDEAAHMGRPDLKVEAIERIDELVIGALLEGLPRLGEYRLLLMPDHATPCELKTHSNEPVPFAIVGSEAFGHPPPAIRRYTESDAAATGLVVTDGHGLIERLFQRPSARAL